MVAGIAGLASSSLGCGFDSPAAPDAGIPDAPDPDSPPNDRVTTGLVALWRFNEVFGEIANDSRMVFAPTPRLAPVPLGISDPPRALWRNGGLVLGSAVRVGTPGPPIAPPHVNRDVLATGEVTMEVWVSPAATSQGDGLEAGLPSYALVLSLSPRYAYHNAMIAQVGDRWQGRVLTATTDANGLPAIETPAGTIADLSPVHLVLVASATERALYVNGTPHRLPPPVDGVGPLNAPAPANRWFDYFPISIGRERELSDVHPRVWLGTVWLAAIYDRALTEAEIQKNLGAGHDCAGC